MGHGKDGRHKGEKGKIVLVVGWATSELMRARVDRCSFYVRYDTTSW